MATRMQQRRGTAAEWAAQNPVLGDGEIGYERDTKNFKIGDGVTTWNALIYSNITHVVQPATTAAVGLTVKGLAAQTGDLQEWQNSAGTVLSKVDTSGAYTVTGGGSSASLSSASLTFTRAGALTYIVQAGINGTMAMTGSRVTASDTNMLQLDPVNGLRIGSSDYPGALPGSAVRLQVRGNPTGQTADLQQWQNYASGQAATRISSSGDVFYTRIARIKSGANSALSGMQLSVEAEAANVVGATIRGFTAQTSDLVRYEDVAGTLLARVANNGGMYAPIVSVSGGPNTGASIFGQVPAGQASGVAMFLIRDNAGNDLHRVMPRGGTWIGVNAAAEVPLTLKGAASQTANLQEWQDSTGAVRAYIAPSGTFYTNASAGVLLGNTTQPLTPGGHGAYLSIVNTAGTQQAGAIIRGIASQAEDLVQIQNSGGGVVAKFDKIGRLLVNPGTLASFDQSVIDAAVLIGASSTADRNLVMRQWPGQTVNMTEWQNNGGSIIASVTSTGNVQGTGAYTTLSDISSKTNVRPLQRDAMAVLKALRPVHYDYIGGELNQVGFVANDVNAILPEAITSWDLDHLGLRTDAILAYLVGAVQQIARRVESLSPAA